MPADALEVELRKLIAERDIRRELFRYQEAVNRGDGVEQESFFGDATIVMRDSSRPDAPPLVMHGGKSFADAFRVSTLDYNGRPMVQYAAVNIVVEVDDSLELATCRSYYFILQGLGDHDYANPEQPRDFPLQPIGCGRYIDTYRSMDGRWQIVEREIYSDIRGDFSRHMRLSPGQMLEEGLLEQPLDASSNPLEAL